MKITFDEIVSRKEWIHSELLNSLTPELSTQAQDDGFFEVKLLVNGVELEPELLNTLVSHIEKVIAEEAKKMVRCELEAAVSRIDKLSRFADELASRIKDEFDLDKSDIC